MTTICSICNKPIDPRLERQTGQAGGMVGFNPTYNESACHRECWLNALGDFVEKNPIGATGKKWHSYDDDIEEQK